MVTLRMDKRLQPLIEAAAIAAGALAFAPWRFDWFHHTLIPGGEMLRVALAMPIVLLLAIYVPLAMQMNRKVAGPADGIPDTFSPALVRTQSVALIVCLAVAILEWLRPMESVWPLYAWVLAAALLLAVRAGEVRWPRLGSRSAACVLILAVALMTGLHIAMQLQAWHWMSFGYADIGHFARALYGVVHGRGPWIDSLNRPLFGEHAFFSLMALVPFCWLGADPFMLLVVFSPLLLNAPALIVYWYARHKGATPGTSLLLGLAWLLLPMHGCLVLSAGYGFHEAQMAVPLLVAGLALTELKRFRFAAVMMGLALLVREDVSLTVAAWAMYVIVFKRRYVLGAGMLTLAAGYFAAMIWVVIPWFRAAPYPHMKFHFAEHHATTITDVGMDLSFVATLVVPMALLCFRQWRLMLVAVPALAETLLTRNIDIHNIAFHYYIACLAPLFLAAATACLNGFGSSSKTTDESPPQPRTAPAMAVGLLFFASYFGQSYWGTGDWTHHPPGTRGDASLAASYPQVRRIHDMLPPGRSVTASIRVAAHFIDADRLWLTPDGVLGDVIVLQETDFCIDRNPREALTAAVRAGGFDPIFADYHLIALARDAGALSIRDQLFSTTNPLPGSVAPFDLGEGIRLVGMRCPRSAGDSSLQVELVWQGDGTTAQDLRFGVTAGERRWGPFYFARGAYPTNAWRPDAFYRDELIIDRRPGDHFDCADLNVVLLK